MCPFEGGCPLLGGSIKRGSTVGEGHRQWGSNLEEQLSKGFTWGGIAVSLKVMGCGHTCN